MSEPRQPKNSLAALKNQLTELTEALQRERADAVNLRRRYDDQLTQLRNSVKSQIVADLLPIVDNLERAIKHAPADLADNDYVKGVQSVVKQFEKTFTDLGVERIQTVGQDFNPDLHEAISLEEGSGSREVVAEELQPGYKIGDQVVRHAMVRVKQSNG